MYPSPLVSVNRHWHARGDISILADHIWGRAAHVFDELKDRDVLTDVLEDLSNLLNQTGQMERLLGTSVLPTLAPSVER